MRIKHWSSGFYEGFTSKDGAFDIDKRGVYVVDISSRIMVLDLSHRPKYYLGVLENGESTNFREWGLELSMGRKLRRGSNHEG